MLENGYADTDDVAKMKEYNYDVVRTFNNQTDFLNSAAAEKEEEDKEERQQQQDELRLTKLSWILTAKAKTVENSIWPLIKNHHPKTIVDLTLKYADRFVFEDFVDLVSKDLNCRFPQVFSLDAWFADSSFSSRSSSSESNNGRTNRDDDEVEKKKTTAEKAFCGSSRKRSARDKTRPPSPRRNAKRTQKPTTGRDFNTAS